MTQAADHDLTQWGEYAPDRAMSESSPITVSDFPSVLQRAESLGFSPPMGMLFLPSNFETAETSDALQINIDASTLRKLMAEAGVPFSNLGGRPAYIINRSAGWHAPALFIAAGVLSQNPNAVSVALNVLSTYVTDFLKGVSGDPKIKLEVVVEKEGDRTCKRLTYEGDAKGLGSLESAIRRMASD